MPTFLADRLARVAKDWQQNLAPLEVLGTMTTTMFETSLQHWQVGFPVFALRHHTEYIDRVGRNERRL